MRMPADAESGIAAYTVEIATSPDKVSIAKESLSGTTQTATLTIPVSTLKLHHVFYATIVAENWAGGTNSASSDGFMITDATSPHSCVAIL